MTDHEMCLAAARAAGYTVEDRGTWILRTYEGGISARWSPLEYGGHAFELMVDCGIDVLHAIVRAAAAMGAHDAAL